jgi:hypothetical protein
MILPGIARFAVTRYVHGTRAATWGLSVQNPPDVIETPNTCDSTVQ